LKINFAAVDFGQEEIEAVNRVLGGTQLASGQENESFEKEFAEYVGSKYAICCNSGSSANLLAISSLGLSKGSKVLTSACGFPATLSPILHIGAVSVLVDYDPLTHNINVDEVIRLLPEVQAVIFAHTLGNPVQMEFIKAQADLLGVPVIEDCCEAVGSSVGKLGTLATWSFYPAHQMTALGGGGMVTTNDEKLYQRMKSLRDWGKTYTWDSSLGGNQTKYTSSIGYHLGYTYDTIGWNFKLPEANAAFGREQLKKLDVFTLTRNINWQYLYSKLKDISQIKIAPMGKGGSPFGFCMDVEDRNGFGNYLEAHGIMHRPFFAGNICRQPAFKDRISGKFPVADYLMNHSLFIGCHTKMTQQDLDYIVETIHAYFDSRNPELERQRLPGGMLSINSTGLTS